MGRSEVFAPGGIFTGEVSEVVAAAQAPAHVGIVGHCPAYQAAATVRARHTSGSLRLAQLLGPFSGIPCRIAGGNTRLSVEVVHCLATQLLACICYLHAQRVVHRENLIH